MTGTSSCLIHRLSVSTWQPLIQGVCEQLSPILGSPVWPGLNEQLLQCRREDEVWSLRDKREEQGQVISRNCICGSIQDTWDVSSREVKPEVGSIKGKTTQQVHHDWAFGCSFAKDCNHSHVV